MICKKCKNDLPLEFFYSSFIKKYKKDSKFLSCIQCEKKERKLSKRNINSLIKQRFDHHKRKGIQCSYEDFSQFIMNNTNFLELYQIWTQNNYEKRFLPSIIRKNTLKPISFDNLIVLQYKDTMKTCSKNKSKRIIQLDLNDNIINIHKNASIAARSIGLINPTNIRLVCIEKRKSCHNFKWKYE